VPVKTLKKDARIMIVEWSGQTRTTISAALREAGFGNYTGASTLADALAVLEVEKVDWVISSLQLDGDVNLFQLMNLCLLHRQLGDVYVSAFYADDQKEEVLHLYELGLMSHHPANYSKTALSATFKTLAGRMEQNGFDSCLTSVDYLRDMLLEVGRSDELVEFSTRVVSSLPGDVRVMLKHATVLASTGRADEAAAALAQTLLISPDLKDQVQAVKAQFLPATELPVFAEGGGVNMLGIVEAVVVDPDEITLNAIRKAMDMIGARKVEYFSDPKEALNYLRDRTEQALIIHEWKMAKVAGPVFIQNVRQLKHEKTPIIIVSSQVTERDQHLTHEMGVAAVVKKPLVHEELLHALIWTMKQELHPTEIKVFERRIMGMLSSKKAGDARNFAKSMHDEKKITQPVYDYFLAEINYAERHYDEAREHCILALKDGYNSVRIFHLFGKVLIKKGDFATAIKCFEKAQELSPLNIIRLCALADANAKSGNKEAAEETIEKAKAIDPSNKSVAITEANYHITFNDIKKASKVLQNVEGFDEVLSYMNNKGISLAVAGQFEQAITYYSRAMDALPDKAAHLKGFISYNMGLAYARKGDLEKAEAAMGECLKAKDAKLVAKSKSLQSRLKLAITRGAPFALNTADEVARSGDQKALEEGFVETAGALTVLTVGPGDRCCYKIYQQPTPPAKLQSHYAKVPVFKTRAEIVRAESMGVEKGMKSG
jgi:tetratricopeptide (TPR) repeat protein